MTDESTFPPEGPTRIPGPYPCHVDIGVVGWFAESEHHSYAVQQGFIKDEVIKKAGGYLLPIITNLIIRDKCEGDKHA